MKGKKLAFAVILALIVCLVLIPVSAYADEPTGDPVVTSDPVPPTTTSTTPVPPPTTTSTTPVPPTTTTSTTPVPTTTTSTTPVPPTTTSTTPVPPTTTSTTPVPPTTTSTTPVPPTTTSTTLVPPTTTSTTLVPPTTTSTTLVPPTTGTPVVTSDPSSVENAGDRDSVEKAAGKANPGTEHIINITNDIDLDKFIELGATGDSSETKITIDLGGHTIKRPNGKFAFAIYGNGSYTFRNGTIYGVLAAYDNVNVTLANNLVCHDTVQAASNSTLHIYGKVEKNTKHVEAEPAPVSTLGNPGLTGGKIFVYEGAEIISGYGDVAVYLPSGSMTVEGGTITGGTGIYIKSSSLTLNGGTIIANGAKQGYVYNGSGCQNTGDAIAVEYSKTGVYGEISAVTVNDGNISSKNGEAIANYVYESNAQENRDKTAVTGGVFSDDSALEYVNKDNTVIAKSNGKYAVGESVLELAKPGATVELVNLPDEYNNGTIDLPGGVTIVNSTDKDITMNGITLKPGESFTVPYSFAYTESYSKYFVVEGEEQEWTKGSADGLTFKLNSEDVIKVLIDGVEVEFTVENGEIVISAEVLEALEAGEHEIEFVFADGSCKTVFTVK